MRNIILILTTILIFQSCATVPVTGRKQLSLISNAELLPMSFQGYEQVLDSSKIINNTAQARMVKSVGKKIQVAVEEFMKMNGQSALLEGYAWDFNLIEADVVNAWCMPGGKVAFYTGIMPICKDEKGVAVVMGHEVAHAIANHGRERMSQGMAAQLGLSSLSVAMGQNPSLTNKLLMQSVGIGTQLGMLKFSRTHESEADRMGLIFMALAGYDPSEAPKFWERMAELSKGQAPPEFLSTHPSHETRISDLNAQIPEAMKYYKN
ncbi:M48 family metallopeptidase [Fulvivirgaceae bacterium BMA10]|uniref:M48 family metallopeptidase n=1 Tax=Splendidivirga corallicola TaxID=3051826 RepID=A0ABT8KH28_9BACT|nr:M48 family metallopeptidase [Fulvivirgaceae bacterium BMA10]